MKTTVKKSTRRSKVEKLDKVFSKYIRLRDSKPYGFKAFTCISCGRTLSYDQADCGHYINRSHMGLRFSEMNCNAQCRHCNRFSEGNNSGYRQGLVRKYGEEKVLLLESSKNQITKYSEFEIDAFIKHYAKLVKEFESSR